MAYSRNHQGTQSNRFPNRASKAYKPKKPFKSVEGIESLAWPLLSPHAVWVLMEFYKRFDGYNRSCLYLSYNDASHKIANNTFNKAIWELTGFGFIDVIRQGRLKRNNTLYALSNRWKKISNNPEKLQTIRKLLLRAERVKHINTPSFLSDEDKLLFKQKRKRILNKIRYRVAGA